jgi:hypothetical protein
MIKKIAKFVIIPFILLFAFLPVLVLADDAVDQTAPKPIFGADDTVGDVCSAASPTCPIDYVCDLVHGHCVISPEKSGVKGIHDTLQGSQVVSTGSIRELIVRYVNFALPLLALAAFTGFVYAGFLYVTAYGSEEQTGKAKKVMIYAIIGLALVILSFSIVQLFTKSLATSISPPAATTTTP